jgi:hypothetical protein
MCDKILPSAMAHRLLSLVDGPPLRAWCMRGEQRFANCLDKLKGKSMRHSILTGIFIAACAFATSQIASAQTLSSAHSYSCRLVNSSAVEVPGTYSGGTFVNNSGSSAWVVCPVPYITGNSNFYMYGTSNISTCYLGATSNSGSQSLYSPTDQSSGYWHWSRQLTPGSYSLEIQCYVPNGEAIYRSFSN